MAPILPGEIWHDVARIWHGTPEAPGAGEGKPPMTKGNVWSGYGESNPGSQLGKLMFYL
jgi:hypothetical protein